MSRAVARGTAINLATRLASVGLVLAITAVAARQGTETQGVFALFTSVEGLLLAAVSGFGVMLARRVSHHGALSRELLGAVVVACVGLGMLAGAALWAFSRVGPPGYASLWLLALAAPLLLLAPNVAGVWLGQGRMGPMAAVSVAPPALALAAIGGFALVGALGLTPLLAAWVGAKAAVGVAVLALLARAGRVAPPDLGALRAELPFVATIAATNLVSLANYRVGLFVVERTLGLSATGVYSIAVMVAELLWFVSGSLTQAVYGRIGTPDRARAAQVTLRALHLGWIALAVAAPLLWGVAAWLLPRLLGEAYAASLAPLAALLPGVLLFGGASAMSAYFTNHAGRPQVPARIAAGSLAANALLSWLLVPALGTLGAALAASAAYGVSVLLLAVRFAAETGIPLSTVLRPRLSGLASSAGGERG